MKRHNMKEFSKRVIVALMILWFIGAIFGMICVALELVLTYACLNVYMISYNNHLADLLTYLGAPITCGVIGYMCKSAFENKEKIKTSVSAPISTETDKP